MVGSFTIKKNEQHIFVKPQISNMTQSSFKKITYANIHFAKLLRYCDCKIQAMQEPKVTNVFQVKMDGVGKRSWRPSQLHTYLPPMLSEITRLELTRKEKELLSDQFS